MKTRRVSLEMQMEEAVVSYLRGSVGQGIQLSRFEQVDGDAEPPIVSVKAERQEEISSGTGFWLLEVTVMGRDVKDAEWAPIEARLLDTTEFKDALNSESMALIDGQSIDYDEPSERDVDEEYQRTFPLRIFAALI